MLTEGRKCAVAVLSVRTALTEFTNSVLSYGVSRPSSPSPCETTQC